MNIFWFSRLHSSMFSQPTHFCYHFHPPHNVAWAFIIIFAINSRVDTYMGIGLADFKVVVLNK